MSNSYEETGPNGSRQSTEAEGKVEAAQHESSDLKDSAQDRATDVLETAKAEAGTVAREAKSQAKDLLAQTQRELKGQAETQQHRLAAGLRTVGDELGSMARQSQGGVAGDLVQQASTRLSAAGSWLGDRDPAGVLTEVKRFARRKPGTFILVAAVTGIVVGRLTRALASNAHAESAHPDPASLPPAPAPEARSTDPYTPMPAGAPDGIEDAPVYAQTAATAPGISGEGGDDDRPHAI